MMGETIVDGGFGAPLRTPETGRYVFRGEDGSLSYRTGETYDLVIDRMHRRYPVTIQRIDGGGWCPYGSVQAFWRNWELAGERQ